MKELGQFNRFFGKFNVFDESGFDETGRRPEHDGKLVTIDISVSVLSFESEKWHEIQMI